MGKLRDYLQECEPKLFESLEQSWDIAFNTWLPAVGPNMDTYNSYPHLRNLELYADKLMREYKTYHNVDTMFLSPLEVYVLLASILFHDIGKSLGGKYHGIRSRKIIEKNWSTLGIPNEELANCIARICEFHDWDAVLTEYAVEYLYTVVVDPYGPIRVREIAAILMLVDHIDGSFIRVVPRFLKDEKFILGAFRDKIRGVDIDLSGGMIKVVLGDNWKKEDNTLKNASGEGEWQFRLNMSFKDKKKSYSKDKKHLLTEITEWLYKQDVFIEYKNEVFSYLRKIDTGYKKTEIEKQIRENNAFSRIIKDDVNLFHVFLVINQVIYLDSTEIKKIDKTQSPDFSDKPSPLFHKSDENKRIFQTMREEAEDVKGVVHYPDWYLLSSILGNVLENHEALIPIRPTLASLGLPIKSWVVECKGHLYNSFGNETVEPVFTKEYLKTCVKCMWELSTRVFAHGELKYETLAAEMREPDIDRVKRAVERIATISRIIKDDKKDRDNTPNPEENDNFPATYPSALWYSNTHWKWNLRHCSEKNDKYCMFLHVEDIVKHINKDICDWSSDDE